jgi:four helix bundle protein
LSKNEALGGRHPKTRAKLSGTELAREACVSGRSFRDLDVWQVAMALADRIYDLTERFPRHELYGMSGQLRRAASSIPSNIAEGTRQRTNKGKAYYYTAANASEAEVETHLELSRRRKYVPEHDIRDAEEELATRVSKMLFKLIESLGNDNRREQRHTDDGLMARSTNNV